MKELTLKILTLAIILTTVSCTDKEVKTGAMCATDVSQTITSDDLLLAQALKKIKQHEGLLLTKKEGFIGYGHYVWDTVTVVNKEQADSILKDDLIKCFEYTNKYHSDKDFNKRLAISMLIYNVGIGTFIKHDLHKHIDTSRWLSLCRYKGKRHKGLYDRRKIEIHLYTLD